VICAAIAFFIVPDEINNLPAPTTENLKAILGDMLWHK
jgi:hypothetical protein